MDNKHLAVMVRNSADKHAGESAIRGKIDGQWVSRTYGEMQTMIDNLASALLEMDVKPEEKVGIFSANRPEWAVADFAVLSLRGITVPIYGTNTEKQAAYIINDASLRIVFAGDQVQYDKLKAVIDDCPTFKIIIALTDDINISDEGSYHFSECLKKGEAAGRKSDIEKILADAGSEELATLIYTSGTTGDPKGVMLTHENFDSQFRAIDERFAIGPKDRSLCFLPLSHAYERTWSYYIFRQGAVNNYIEDPGKIVEYMPDVNPTAMVSVPRLFEKIYATVQEGLQSASPVKKALFNWATRVGLKYQYRKRDGKMVGPLLGFNHALADKLVLSKIRNVVGGEKNFFSAGGAPLSQEIEEFFLAANLLVCQGYGLSETAPMLSCNAPGGFKFGTVGRPIKDCVIKIDDTGEILAKGPMIMKGYYNKPEATQEAFNEDGWFRTGDVGHLDEDGYLRITDRIKDLIITSGGKNIAPLHIETLVGLDFYIEQICTIGDKRKYISALIVPNFPALEEWATEKGVTFTSREDLVQNKKVKDFYEERIKLNSGELAQYEKIKAFTLLPGEFTQDGGELTPTQKVKRKVIAEKYADIIDSMYSGE